MAHGPDTEKLLKMISEMEWGKLDIHFMKVTSLPELPNGLYKLWCHITSITSLPKLPDNLEEIICNYSPLRSLPDLPLNLVYLDLGYTQLRTLPKLPKSLRILMVPYTQLISLPDLPQFLETLYCNHTEITEIPEIPRMLYNLSVSNCPNLLIQKEPGETIKDYNERWSKIRIQRRNEAIKENLIAYFWKPSRVNKILKDGGWDLVDSY
jgi:Leucine-rich repeat (LRR) protein